MLYTLNKHLPIKRENNKPYRDVAQLGSAPCSGRGGRKFESCHPDFLLNIIISGFIYAGLSGGENECF